MRRLGAALAGAAFFVFAATPALSVGTIFGLPLSQQLGEDGKPLSGALLYIYQANTSSPVTIYTDFALSVEATWPLEADAEGRLPQFWLADGAYRVRLTTAAGVGVFDLQNVTALGPSSGAGGGGGVSNEQIFVTGDTLFRLVDATRSGWVRANGRTIGSAASGATERANADTQALFEYVWNNCTDANCPISGGRGANAATDFAANKTIAVWDLRGRSPFGLDTMGTTAAGRIAGGTGAGDVGGAESVTLTEANLPAHDHGLGAAASYATGANVQSGGSVTVPQTVINLTLNAGSDQPFSILPPHALGTWYVKL